MIAFAAALLEHNTHNTNEHSNKPIKNGQKWEGGGVFSLENHEDASFGKKLTETSSFNTALTCCINQL